MTDLYLYDDLAARTFEPFSLTRPTSELRAGALLLRERWERASGLKTAGVITSPHLVDFDEPWGAHAASGSIPAGSLIANSRFAVDLARLPAGDVWSANGTVAAVRLAADTDLGVMSAGRMTLDVFAKERAARAVPVSGYWIEHVWDCIGRLNDLLGADIPALIAAARDDGGGEAESSKRRRASTRCSWKPAARWSRTWCSTRPTVPSTSAGARKSRRSRESWDRHSWDGTRS